MSLVLVAHVYIMCVVHADCSSSYSNAKQSYVGPILLSPVSDYFMCGLTLLQACLRLKGENGIMRKKFQALQKDIEEQREQLTLQHEQQKELYNTIKGRHLVQRVVHG